MKNWGVLRDDIIGFTGPQSIKKFPGELRLVEIFDKKTQGDIFPDFRCG